MNRLSKEDQRRLVEAQKRSGKSAVGFCREVGIAPSTFAGYKRAVENRSVVGAPVLTGQKIVLELNNGKEIKVHRSNLKEVLEALSL
jgi:transposase-like protein